jgi:hypothetical protein
VYGALLDHISVQPRSTASALPASHRAFRPARGARDVVSPVFKHHKPKASPSESVCIKCRRR